MVGVEPRGWVCCPGRPFNATAAVTRPSGRGDGVPASLARGASRRRRLGSVLLCALDSFLSNPYGTDSINSFPKGPPGLRRTRVSRVAQAQDRALSRLAPQRRRCRRVPARRIRPRAQRRTPILIDSSAALRAATARAALATNSTTPQAAPWP